MKCFHTPRVNRPLGPEWDLRFVVMPAQAGIQRFHLASTL